MSIPEQAVYLITNRKDESLVVSPSLTLGPRQAITVTTLTSGMMLLIASRDLEVDPHTDHELTNPPHDTTHFQGIRGPTGPQGIPGQVGIQGIQGLPGTRYDVAAQGSAEAALTSQLAAAESARNASDSEAEADTAKNVSVDNADIAIAKALEVITNLGLAQLAATAAELSETTAASHADSSEAAALAAATSESNSALSESNGAASAVAAAASAELSQIGATGISDAVAATASDRLQTGLDRLAVENARLEVGLDAHETLVAKTITVDLANSVNTLFNLIPGFVDSASASATLAGTNSENAALSATDAAEAAVSAASSAAALSSLSVQDINSSALHRSPTTVSSVFIYDATKDSDGGSWVERTSDKSWYNEPLVAGTWLPGGFPTESAARSYTGAATGSYFQLSTNGKFYKLSPGSGVTEVFRGNKAKFPLVSAIVGDYGSVTIYDLTEPGSPMWMRFVAGTRNGSNHVCDSGVICVTALNGILAVGANGGGLSLIKFVHDESFVVRGTGYLTFTKPTIAFRNAAISTQPISGMPSLRDSRILSVVLATLRDAPVDIVSGLSVPTIWVNTAKGVDRIAADNTVSYSTNLGWPDSYVKLFVYNNYLIRVAGANFVYNYLEAVKLTDTLDTAWLKLSPNPLYGATWPAHKVENNYAGGVYATNFGVVAHRPCYYDISRSLEAYITSTYNTGYMVGLIKRAYLCSVDTGAVPPIEYDRSIKHSTATVYGALTREAVAPGSQLVGYSGFSATNYIQEPYSADLNFGTGRWSVSAWVKYLEERVNKFVGTEDFNALGWASVGLNPYVGGGFTETTSTSEHRLEGFLSNNPPFSSYAVFSAEVKADGRYRVNISTLANSYSASFDLTAGTITANTIGVATITPVADGYYKITCSSRDGLTIDSVPIIRLLHSNGNSIYEGDGVSGIKIRKPQLESGVVATNYQSVTTAESYDSKQQTIVERSSVTAGQFIKLETNGYGALFAIVSDGTRSRAVTTPAKYNTGLYNLVAAHYKGGRLWIEVNGVEVAATTEAPLLPVNNPSAVLTIGNGIALDTPLYSGSIALLKIGATTPFKEQSAWAYSQEKRMFLAGSKVTLATADVVDNLNYDEKIDTWVVGQVNNLSVFNGLTRKSITAISSGAAAVADLRSKIRLISRNASQPGVDVTVPGYVLRPELLKATAEKEELNRNISIFNFDPYVFSADTTAGSNVLTNVIYDLGTQPAPYIGLVIGGQGVAVGSTVENVFESNIILDKPATSTNGYSSLSQAAFRLPAGWTALEVRSSGQSRREGPTKDYIRMDDGFCETIRFFSGQSSSASVQITAIRNKQ